MEHLPSYVNFIHVFEQLCQNEKGFFGRSMAVLHQGEGPIRTIKWKSHFVAWANDMVRITVSTH